MKCSFVRHKEERSIPYAHDSIHHSQNPPRIAVDKWRWDSMIIQRITLNSHSIFAYRWCITRCLRTGLQGDGQCFLEFSQHNTFFNAMVAYKKHGGQIFLYCFQLLPTKTTTLLVDKTKKPHSNIVVQQMTSKFKLLIGLNYGLF